MTDFHELRRANTDRQTHWDAEQRLDLSFRAMELGGEAGEALNVAKKLVRAGLGLGGSRATLDDLAEELADVVICTDLLAMTAGIDLDAAVVAKFNATSLKLGLPTRISDRSSATSDGQVEMDSAQTADPQETPTVARTWRSGRRFLPYSFFDEAGPAARETPEAWLTAIEPRRWRIEPGDDAGYLRPIDVAVGDAVSFVDHIDHGRIVFTIATDGSFTTDLPIPAGANWFVCADEDYVCAETSAESFSTAWTKVVEEPGEIAVYVSHWGDEERFRLAVDEFGAPHFEPIGS